ncbi:hypothetical protein HDU88_007296 [Geranomyces variabilis]|nr:hypothetical protein HDU88_007296 [Geranomyces variabilis]
MPLSNALSGGGTMGELVRSKDWSTTKLGPPEDWAQSLKTSVSFILNAAFPFILFWGDHHSVIYNDQYIPIFGGKHPRVLGQPAYEAWGEVYNIIGPMLDDVRRGNATFSENQLLELTRNGYCEECYFTWSYSPVRIEDGTVGGVMTPITETTKTVLSERRLNLLRELAANTANTQSEEEACTLSAQIFEQHCADITFALIYMLDGSGRKLLLKGFSNVESSHSLCVNSINREEQGSWPVDQVFSQSAIVLPLEASTNQEPIGLVVFGINPRRELDSDYKDFLELARTQLAASVLRGRSLTEKQQRLQALAEIDRAKSVFFSNISHEYRTPLSLILGPVADLLSDSSLSSSQMDKIRLVERNAQRLHKLVNSVLDFSQLEAGRMEANFRLTDISVATANAASMFRSAMEKGKMKYAVETPPLGEMVYLDVDMWEKIVLNLISNAFKYTIKGGVKVRIYKDETTAVLEVEDTGCGVPENEIARLFERFHRCQVSNGRSVEGTGIGLSLTQELVKLHGGAISATSTLGVGTKFTVSIPLGKGHIPSSHASAQDQPDATTPSSVGRAFVQESARWITESSSYVGSSSDNPESASVGTSANEDTLATGSSDPGPFNDGRMARVVLADDNADMREYVGSLLAKFCVVHVAKDGRHAYESILQNPPDVIVSDVMMPFMNGFELLQKIREQPHLKHIPFVLLSAHAGEEARVEGLQAGADDYLVKPFSGKELRARVRTQIALGRMRKELDRLVKARTAELQESSRQFQLLSNISPVGISRLNMKGEVVFVNKAWWKIVGRDPSTHDPNDWQQWVKPETIEDVHSMMSVGKAEVGAAPRRETTLVRPDGTEVTVIGTCIFDDGSGEDGQVHEYTGAATDLDLEKYSDNAGFYFASMDITEEKKLEEQRINALLKLSEEQRRRAEDADENRRHQEAFVDTICHEIRNPLSGVRNCADLLQVGVKRLWSVTRTVQSAVNAWKSMSGTEFAGSSPDLNGKRKWSAPVDMNDFMRYLDECVIPSFKNQLLEDHETIDAISMCTNHQEVITNDVLQLSKLKHNKSYSPVICAPEVVVSRVMQMFRTLLRKKRINFAWNLSVKTEGEAEAKTYSKFRNLVDAELVFAEPDRLAQIMFNLVTNAIKFTEKSANEKLITIALDVTYSVIEEADAENGEPQKQHSTDIKVSVKDTGIGMSDAEQQKLFQRFSQASVKTYSTYGGSGLGLSICRQLIDMMGGQIGLTSAANAGTNVFFRLRCKRPTEQEMREFRNSIAESEATESLSAFSSSAASSSSCSSLDQEGESFRAESFAHATPCSSVDQEGESFRAESFAHGTPSGTCSPGSRPPPTVNRHGNDSHSNGVEKLTRRPSSLPCEQPEPPQPRKELRLEDLKVLIVEDNMINQKVLRKQLDKEGATTEVANNGLEAVEQFMKSKFDVIICDVEMPVMNGLEATRQIRALEESKSTSTPIMGLSGNARDMYRESAIAAGMNRYLVKPYSKPVLFENLVELANQARSSSS